MRARDTEEVVPEQKIGIEHWPFLLFVFLLPFPTLFSIPFFGMQLQIADLMFVAALAVWGVTRLKEREYFQWSWFYPWLGAYLAAVALSAAASVNPEISYIKSAGKLYLVLIAFLAFNNVRSATGFKWTVGAWISGAGVSLLLSGLGILGFYLGWRDPGVNLVVHPVFGSLPPGSYPRIEGFFEYPAMYCNFLGVTWIFAVLYYLAGWVRQRHFVAFAGLLVLADVFTLTPGLGGVFLTCGYFLLKFVFTRRPAIGRSALLAGVLVSLIFLVAASITLFSFDRTTGFDVPVLQGGVSASHRADAWGSSFRTFLEFPVLGRGVGMPVADARYTDPSGNNQLLTDAHNTYLSVLAETGAAGFLAFFGMILFLINGLWKQDDVDGLHRLAGICILLAIADAVLYQGITGSYEDARHLWVLFGIAAAVSLGPALSDENAGHVT